MDALLTLRQAAQRLSLSRPAVRALVKSGALTSVPLPGSTAANPHRRIRASDLDAYIASLGAADAGRR